MPNTVTEDLEKFALEAGREIAGPGVFEQVEVRPTADLDDRPAYLFTILLNPHRIVGEPGLPLVDLRIRLRRELEARGDEHRPMTRYLERRDWHERHRGIFD